MAFSLHVFTLTGQPLLLPLFLIYNLIISGFGPPHPLHVCGIPMNLTVSASQEWGPDMVHGWFGHLGALRLDPAQG